MAPECYELDAALLARPGNDEIQLAGTLSRNTGKSPLRRIVVPYANSSSLKRLDLNTSTASRLSMPIPKSFRSRRTNLLFQAVTSKSRQLASLSSTATRPAADTGVAQLVSSRESNTVDAASKARSRCERGSTHCYSAARNCRTPGGSLFPFASNWLTCHICVSDNVPLNAGIPVSRMPFATFQ